MAWWQNFSVHRANVSICWQSLWLKASWLPQGCRPAKTLDSWQNLTLGFALPLRPKYYLRLFFAHIYWSTWQAQLTNRAHKIKGRWDSLTLCLEMTIRIRITTGCAQTMNPFSGQSAPWLYFRAACASQPRLYSPSWCSAYSWHDVAICPQTPCSPFHRFRYLEALASYSGTAHSSHTRLEKIRRRLTQSVQ